MIKSLPDQFILLWLSFFIAIHATYLLGLIWVFSYLRDLGVDPSSQTGNWVILAICTVDVIIAVLVLSPFVGLYHGGNTSNRSKDLERCQMNRDFTKES